LNDGVVDYLIGVLNGVKPDNWRLAWLPMFNASIVLRNDSNDTDDWVSIENWSGVWRVKVYRPPGSWASMPFDVGDHDSVVSAFRALLAGRFL
jgi:hypothetical protein